LRQKEQVVNLPYKFDIEYSESKRHFEEELYLTGHNKTMLTKGIMDTGATITLVDLQYALDLGAHIVRTDRVVGVSGVPSIIYIVRLGVEVTHQESGKKPITYRKTRMMGSMPHLWKGGAVPSVLIKSKDGTKVTPMPLLSFTVGFPGMKTQEIISILDRLVQKDGKLAVENTQRTGLGVPLLVGVDILKDLAVHGFKVEFDF
jgi:hypothetical protein